jgi:hypothetical protein
MASISEISLGYGESQRLPFDVTTKSSSMRTPSCSSRNVDPGFDRDHHTRFQRTRRIAYIVHVQPEVVARPVNEVLLVAF